MDSYSYRDGPGRSPPERGWNARDDRMKDERLDSFYRGRSPGMFSNLIQEPAFRRAGRLPVHFLDSNSFPVATDRSSQNYAI